MKDQLRFHLTMKEVHAKNERLQLYGPLSPISSNGWDSVGSSSISRYMMDRPSKEATSQSFDTVENFTHIASVFRSAKNLARIRPSLHLPDPLKYYEFLPCGLSDQIIGDPREGCFYMLEIFFTQ